MLHPVDAALLDDCRSQADKLLRTFLDASASLDNFAWALVYLAAARTSPATLVVGDADAQARERISRAVSGGLTRHADTDLAGALLLIYVLHGVRGETEGLPTFEEVETALSPYYSDADGFFRRNGTYTLAVALGLSAYPERAAWQDLPGLITRWRPGQLDSVDAILWNETRRQLALPAPTVRQGEPTSSLAEVIASDVGSLSDEALRAALKTGRRLISSGSPLASMVALFALTVATVGDELYARMGSALTERWTANPAIARIAGVAIAAVPLLALAPWVWLGFELHAFDPGAYRFADDRIGTYARILYAWMSLILACVLARLVFGICRTFVWQGKASDALLGQELRAGLRLNKPFIVVIVTFLGPLVLSIVLTDWLGR